MADLPACLNRKLWSPKQWENLRVAWDLALSAERKERDRLAQQAEKVRAEARDKKIAKAVAAVERRARNEGRIKKNAFKAGARMAVYNRLASIGPSTVHKLRQVVAEPMKPFVSWAVRTMLKEGRIKKLSKKVYEVV